MSLRNSPAVGSNQVGVHPRLEAAVRKHLQRPWSPPITPHCAAAFARWRDLAREDGRPLILDSGCGNGASTLALARRYPDCAVLGVDKSKARLATKLDDDYVGIREGATFLRCELAQFWRLLRVANLRVERHYLFYPNPWPKSVHYLRRWHAHPAFADLIGLGGALELRTNWKIYAEEFSAALRVAGIDARISGVESDSEALSPFERKYRDSGHALWRVMAAL